MGEHLPNHHNSLPNYHKQLAYRPRHLDIWYHTHKLSISAHSIYYSLTIESGAFVITQDNPLESPIKLRVDAYEKVTRNLNEQLDR